MGFEGLVDATHLTGDDRFIGFAHGAIKAWIPRARPYTFWDNTAPGHAMCLVHEELQDDAILAAAMELADYLRTRRRVHGVLVAFEHTPLHPPSSGEPLSATAKALLDEPGAGIFVDCIHFDPPFFAHLGSLLGSTELIEEAVGQACAAIDVLQDDETGLFAHFYLERTGRRYGLGWSRGQGWALLGLLDVLKYVPTDFPRRARLVTALRDLVAALAREQDTSGHWHGRIGDPESPLETSAALFFTAGITRGVKDGVFDDGLDPVADRAWSAALGRVLPDGSITGVSAAVWPSPADSHYRGVPVGLQVPWGQGPFLAAARVRSA